MQKIIVAMVLVAAAKAAAGQEATPLQEPESLEVPAKTVVQITIADTISSRTARIGDMFQIRLVEPVQIDGRLVLPVGLGGRGEVTHVAKAGWGGKPGELIVMVRYLECGSQKIPVGRFQLGGSGESHGGTALGASIVVPLAGFFIDGGDMTLRAGTRGNVKISAAVTLPVSDRPCSM